MPANHYSLRWEYRDATNAVPRWNSYLPHVRAAFTRDAFWFLSWAEPGFFELAPAA